VLGSGTGFVELGRLSAGERIAERPALSTERCPPPANSESLRSASFTVSEVSIAASIGVMTPPLSRMADSSSRSLSEASGSARRRLLASCKALARSATAGIIRPKETTSVPGRAWRGKDAENERAEDEYEAQAHLDVVEALRLAALALDLTQLSPPRPCSRSLLRCRTF
jgi:hypothetical protein